MSAVSTERVIRAAQKHINLLVVCDVTEGTDVSFFVVYFLVLCLFQLPMYLLDLSCQYYCYVVDAALSIFLFFCKLHF